MIVFRWVLGVLAVILASGGVITFLLYLANGDDRWVELARRFRRLLWATCLFWFNVEIWGRVIYTLIHW